MPSTIFSGSDIKTLKDNLSLNDKAKILPSNGSPAAGAGVAAPVGSLALDYTNGKTYKKIGALDTDWSELGSGVGGINYITNSDAEAGTNGWSTYADAAGAQPVDGTGGSPNVTWTRSTTTPLRGTADFNFAKDAANRQGQGVATDITINLADQAKVLTVSFDYEILSGTYATGDLTVYLIQDPAGTPVIIQPAGYQIQAATAGTKMKQIAVFQTASSGQTYRLCFHVASTSASAYTLAIDNVIVGPQVVQYGAPVTDWQSYTPTFTGFGTCTNIEFYWRRVGGDLEISGKFTTGTTTAVEGRISLPSGLTSTAFTQGIRVAGVMIDAYSASTRFSLYTLIESSQTYMTFGAQDSASNGLTKANGNQLASTSAATVTFTCPILGWSSTVQMSNDTDTRVVAASITGNPTSVTAGNIIIFPSTDYDTHGAYNASTGRYTVPVAGFYKLGGAITGATSVFIYVYKNGVQSNVLASTSTTNPAALSGTIQCNAGDLLDFRPDNTFDATAASHVTIERLSGPSAIAATEDVIVSCIDTSGTTIGTTDTDAGRTLVPFASEEIDTHGSFSSGVFTAPISGKYEIIARFQTISTTASNAAIHIYKSGASLARGYTFSAAASVNHNPSISKIISLVAGDTIEIRGRCSSSVALDTTSAPCGNLLSIKRIGN